MDSQSPKVLVIGGSSSVGNEVVRQFAKRGARLLVTVRGTSDEIDRYANATIAQLDLANTETIDAFCRNAIPAFGNLDVVISLAGVLPGLALDEYDDDLMRTVMDVNFTNQAALLKRLLPHLNVGSHVIFVSSISAQRGSYDPIYAASKAAQIAFVKSVATWLAPNVRVNAVAPALIDGSAMFSDMSEERRQHHIASTPTKRLTTTSEVAGIICSMTEVAWANLNGQVIGINGGAHV